MTTQPSGQEPQRPTQSSQPPPSASPSQPSSSERPTGPPSGPLSGGQQGPPSAPPPAPPGATPPGPPGAGGPWWRSVPRLAVVLVAVAAVVTLVVVLTRPSGSPSARGEVFLQPAAATGPAPFTESTATKEATPVPPAPPSSTQSAAPTAATRSVSGSAPGLYGGTKDVASCDVEKQVRALSAEPAKNEAFAGALGIRSAAVPGYLRSLTPVRLMVDTRVTNHGYNDGKATPYQAVLQAGTAVLVDGRGVPRVRCACGNPLGAPVALTAEPKRHGQPWPSYQPSKVVVIAPSPTVIEKFVIYDHHDRRWYERDRGAHQQGRHDKPVAPPVFPTPPVTPTPPSPATSSPPPTHPTPPVTSSSPVESPATSPAESPSTSQSESSSAPQSAPQSESSSAPQSSSASTSGSPSGSPSGSVTPSA
ncbi:DUF6777 domain-containing protein [Streptomyces sp. NPDC006430]|uniref:DUF6777 domain-containing protein n=1 Tax=Streptomyces sp. NPDC006430 TaxID=3154299 RepID=UPI0033BA2904